ncbi:hypothetical protein C9374_002268 [Naegleria lovaniensis]|uniref:malate dehydrogenase n=1 Tax=Naegleria lovaniensis TaxID=51637 RepID=A0AA88GVL1_NAELO|nr:uncharacterized protein C9374_002268 [Naegleria lovaniensis]KAG2386524.1 hypothetical protein C9374_002268 [Naegleria lovaniensis]
MLSKTCTRLLKTSNQKFTTSLLNTATQKRFYADDVDGRQSALEESIASILTKQANEYEVTKELAFLSSTIKNEEDFSYLMRLASKVGSKLAYSGVQDVGYMAKKPVVRVAVTGAAGQIAYSLIPRIASGEMLGKDQPVHLVLIDIPDSMKLVEGVQMELQDCAFPLLRGITVTSDLAEGFKDVEYTLLVGAKPRSKGMERKDLLLENAKIFQTQGKALGKHAKSNNLTLVVGNPANTNALIAASNASNIDPKQFSAMTRLDHDRALAQVALKLNVPVRSLSKFAIWGNHSATQYPDLSNALVDNVPVLSKVDKTWVEKEFIPTVQQRGAAIINVRGSSSAASAADAAIKHMRDWALGTPVPGEWVSMAVPSDGSYGIKPGVYTSYPVICPGGGKYEIVKDLKIDQFSQDRITASVKELLEEKSGVQALLK